MNARDDLDAAVGSKRPTANSVRRVGKRWRNIFTVPSIITDVCEIFKMRMRKKRNGNARIQACSDYLIENGEEIDRMREEGLLPCRLEIGCGKGDFAVATSKKHLDEPYIAMEMISDVILCGLEKARAANCPNLKFIIGNAKDLPNYFQKGDIRVIYLNFSDPWPKKGYAKRRLTHRGFLEIYKSILTKDGKICFKTDNAGFFEFSLEEFEQSGFELSELTRNLHESEYAKDNIETEYERRFSSMGFPIHRVVATLKQNLPAGV